MRSKIRKPQIARMTLIEVMIAMVILVIIMGFLTLMLSKAQLVTRAQNRRADIYNQQRLFFDILSRDLESVVVLGSEGQAGDQTVPINFTMISGKGIGMVTTSGIGFTDTDSSPYLEVMYLLNSDSDLVRHYTAQRHGADWDYKTNSSFTSTMADSSVVLEGVRDFTVTAYDSTGTALSSTYSSDVLPSYVEFKVTVVPDDLEDDTTSAENQFRYSFSKIIYFQNGGN